MSESAVRVEDVICNNLHIGKNKGEPQFQLNITKSGRCFCKIRDREVIELDYDKMYDFLKEYFKK